MAAVLVSMEFSLSEGVDFGGYFFWLQAKADDPTMVGLDRLKVLKRKHGLLVWMEVSLSEGHTGRPPTRWTTDLSPKVDLPKRS